MGASKSSLLLPEYLGLGIRDWGLGLAPDHPEVHLEHGYYYYFGSSDWEPALEQAELGLKGQPGNADIYELIGFIKRRQGKWEEAAAALKKAAELDPRRMDLVIQTGWTYLFMRNWAEAERYADYHILLWPELAHGYTCKATVYLWSKGDIEKAREIYQEALKIVGTDILIEWRSRLEIYSRDYQNALDIVEADPADRFLTKADIYRYMGRPERAAAYYDSARVTYEEQVREAPDDYAAHGNLGIAYAGLGRREEAIREGKLAVEIMPLSRDAGEGLHRLNDLAKIYTMLGEQDAAIDQLEVLLSVPSQVTVPLLKIDPRWDPLREHPRFRALVSGGLP